MVQASGNNITKQILKQTDKVIYFCSDHDFKKNEAVHEIRKSFKRIRAWLHLLKNLYEKESLKKDYLLLLDHNKKLSPIRESYVNLICFEQHFNKKQYLPEKKTRQISNFLRNENQKQLLLLDAGNHLFEDIKNNVFLFNKDIKIGYANELTDKNIYEDIYLSYKKSFTKYLECREDFSSEILHKLRIKLKRLWYQYELINSLQAKNVFYKEYKLLHSITDMLGTDHDNFILSQQIQKSCFNFITKNEQSIFNKFMQLQHESALNYLLPELKNIFSLDPDNFKTQFY